MKNPISSAFSSSIYPGQSPLQRYVTDLGVHLHRHGLKVSSRGLITPFIFQSFSPKCPFVKGMSDYLHCSWFTLTEGIHYGTLCSYKCFACKACLKMFKLFVRWLQGSNIALNQWLLLFFFFLPSGSRSQITNDGLCRRSSRTVSCSPLRYFLVIKNLETHPFSFCFCGKN